jgi:hypothetical protein
MSRAVLVRLVLVVSLVSASRAGARTPEAFECQSRLSMSLAKVGARCSGRTCPDPVVARARARVQKVLAKRQEVTPPAACLPRVCRAADTPDVCADELVSGPDPIGDWPASDFRCLARSGKVLARLARSARACFRNEANEVAPGAFDLDGCLARVLAESREKLALTIDIWVGRGASAERCLAGVCRGGGDAATCVEDTLSGSVDGPGRPGGGGGGGGEPGGGDPGGGDVGDLTAEEAECRAESTIVLQEFDQRVSKCREDSNELAACLEEARGKREVKVAKLLDKSVRPDACFPGICTREQTPEACAWTVFEAHAPGSGGPPPSAPDGNA